MTDHHLLSYILGTIGGFCAFEAIFMSVRWQNRRTESLEKYCRIRDKREKKKSNTTLIAQAISTPWSWKGQNLDWGLYCSSSSDIELALGKCAVDIVFNTSCSLIYWGKYGDIIASELLRSGLKLHRDPRGRLAMPHSWQELEEMLDENDFNMPWILTEEVGDAQRLAELHIRYPCGIMILGHNVAPLGYTKI